MQERKITQTMLSRPSVDGAGVHLRRIFHRKDTFDIDPFLLLDLFDSGDPNDYTAGFPLHPHRGIETFTYLMEGEIHHKDTLGNQGAICSGDYQWMSSGSGIMHEEMPQPSPHMLGFQLWINLACKNKMSTPSYLSVLQNSISIFEENCAKVRVLSGNYKGVGPLVDPKHHAVEIYDFDFTSLGSVAVPLALSHNVLLAVLKGTAQVGNTLVEEKSAVRLENGDTVTIGATQLPTRVMLFAGERLDEPIAWGGSLVMNTKQELETAYRELEEGAFIKHKIKID